MAGLTRSLVAPALAVLLLFGSAARAQTVWQRYSGNPVIPGPAGGGYAFSPSVLFDASANLYRMWFTARTYGETWSIYSAISNNGVTWFAYVVDPVLQGGSAYFDSDGVVYCSVIREGTGYRMYYTGVRGCCGIALGLATSSDGIHWTKSSANPVLSPSPAGWDSQGVSQPQVYFDGSTYFLYYEGKNGAYAQIGLATSVDGIRWIKAASNPILSNGGPGAWDETLASPGGLFVYGGTFYMLFTGQGASGPQLVGLATSRDGISWSEDPGNPVFTGGGVANWDWSIRAGSVLQQNSTLKMWYSGDPVDDGGWATGYATSSFAPAGVTPEIPVGLMLHQNAPNPFHRETRIAFELPRREFVTLKVFNIQGQAVATLVSEEMDPGAHSLTFAPAAWRLAGGVYFCRLTAGAGVQSTKMFLLR